MTPIKFKEQNIVAISPEENVGDLPGRFEDGVFLSVWKPSDEERDAIASGGYVALYMWTSGPDDPAILPVSLTVINGEPLQ